MGVNDNPMVPPPVPYWYRKCSYCGYPITDEGSALVETRTVRSGGAAFTMVSGRMWESQAHRDLSPPLFSPGSYPDRVVKDGASNYWRFEESGGLAFADLIGQSPAIQTSTNGITYQVSGATSDGCKGIGVNGSSTAIFTPTPPVVVGPSCTLELWFRPEASGEPAALVIGGAAGGPGLYFNHTTRRLNFDTGTSNSSNTTLTNGVLYHVAISINAGNATFYVNGVADGTATNWAGRSLSAMLSSGPALRALTASLVDEFAIYPRALTAQEIAAHYALRTA